MVSQAPPQKNIVELGQLFRIRLALPWTEAFEIQNHHWSNKRAAFPITNSVKHLPDGHAVLPSAQKKKKTSQEAVKEIRECGITMLWKTEHRLKNKVLRKEATGMSYLCC